MFDKLDFILEKYEELSMKVSDPDVINNQPLWQKYIKEIGEMEPIVNKYKEYKAAKTNLNEAKEMLESGDEELRELAKMELSDLEDKIPEMESQLKILLLPKDPNDDKNVILEVRAGTGGEEAALFAQDLLRMYLRYAERRGWKAEIMDANDTGIGGIKEASVLIKGKGAYLTGTFFVSFPKTAGHEAASADTKKVAQGDCNGKDGKNQRYGGNHIRIACTADKKGIGEIIDKGNKLTDNGWNGHGRKGFWHRGFFKKGLVLVTKRHRERSFQVQLLL